MVGTKVYLYAAPQVAGTSITAKVDKVGVPVRSPRQCGLAVVDRSAHRLDALARSAGDVANRPTLDHRRKVGSIGTVGGGYAVSSCWRGVHLHVEMGNAHNFSCYNGGFHFGHPWGDTIHRTNFIGFVGGQRTTASRQPCPSTPVVTNYVNSRIVEPRQIVAGPDGALWFTNSGNNSIGRITTSGTVTSYTGTGIKQPGGIAAGPDGALWFTNYGNNSIGRITTTELSRN